MKSGKSWVGLPFPDTSWASEQRNISHRDTPFPVPPQHYGSCLDREGGGPKSTGRIAGAHPLLKGDRGEGKAPRRFLPLKEMERGGGAQVLVGWYQQEQLRW